MTDQPRYATLRDYLRVIREQRIVIVLVALLFGGAALALSLRQDATYRASSTLVVRDLGQDFNLIGATSDGQDTPQALAPSSATLVKRGDVAARVRQRLRTNVPAAQLADMITTRVDPQSPIISIDGTGKDKVFIARVVNAFGDTAAQVATAEARARFRRAGRDLRRRYTGFRRTVRDDVTRALYADRITRVEFLADYADPIVIGRRATAPQTPISPRPVRNTLLGLLIGLTLGTLVGFSRDSLDRRLRGAAEIGELFDWPVVGHVRASALGTAGAALSKEGRTADESDLEAFRILRANLQFLDVDSPPRTVLVTSPLPAEGKSTVAGSLAYASAGAGRSTLLVECDLRRPSLSSRFGLEPDAKGLSDYLLGHAAPQEVIQAVTVGEPSTTNGADPSLTGGGTLAVITAGSPTAHPGELLGSERFRSFLLQVSEAYDLVILDSSPLLSVVDTMEIVPQVEGVLVCIRANQTTREQALAASQALERVPRRPTGIVVTGLRAGDETDFGYYSYAYAYRPRATSRA